MRLANLFGPPEFFGVLLLDPEILRAGRPGSPVYGRQRADGDDRWFIAESLCPGPSMENIGRIAEPEVSPNGGDPDRIELELANPPRARIGRRRLEVIINDRSRYRDRISALPDAGAIAGKSAALAGLGSVGSALGAALARVGVRVSACDPDRLAMENLVRWGLLATPDHDVGRLKARVWEDALMRTVPGAEVAGHVLDVVRGAQRFDAILREARPDLLIAATDTRDSRAEVNAAASRLGVPALFVSLSDGAASVRIEVVQDARVGPCHLCSAHAEDGFEGRSSDRRSLTPYAADIAEAGEYPGMRNAMQQAVPALPVDVAIGTALATRVALTILAGADWRRYFEHGEQRGSVMFMSLRPDWWVFDEPWDRMVYQPARRLDCPTCGDLKAVSS